MSIAWAYLGDMHYPTMVYGPFCRLWPSEVAAEWGEAFWTSPDLWRVP